MERVCFKHSHKEEKKFSTGSWVRASTSVLPARGRGGEGRNWQERRLRPGGVLLVGLARLGDGREVAVATGSVWLAGVGVCVT